ncbi:hypothetical protein [Sphingomonas yabuuchiae]|uniref:hypothetical protein n=1 Tax=Sphingomonas yabuuchiae TaxID=172044 RepID=UPI0030B8C956
MTQGEREELLEAMLVDAPELTFTSRGYPDPRLIQLARLLGRQMARETFAAQTDIISKRGSNGS